MLFLLCLLALAQSQYIESYAGSSCSGSPVQGGNGILGVCDNGILAACMGGTLYISVFSGSTCTGSATNLSLASGVCTPGLSGSYKGFCSGSTSAPSGAISQRQYQAGQCSGSSSTSWILLNACVPDGPTQSTSSMTTQGQGGYIQTSYSTGDCSGTATGTSFLPSGFSGSAYYSTTSESWSNMAFVNMYANPQCTGNPVSGQAVPASSLGMCDGQGTWITCMNGVATMTTYENYNCTGTPNTQNLTTTTGCNAANMMMATCSGTLTIPSMFVAAVRYKSTGCAGAVQSIQWWATGTGACVPAGLTVSYEFAYSSSTNLLSQEVYATGNCTGTASTTPISYLRSSTLTSSSILNAGVSKFISATAILILSSYLF